MNPLHGKHILLGITGSIAAYKAADLASKLAQAGAEVDIILTEASTRFVSPLTYQSVTGRSAHTDAELWGAEAHILHVKLSKPADAFLIAPASANTIAKLAHGLADNLLTITALAATCPLVIAPAMDGGMFASPAQQENLAILIKRGALIIGPEEGHLASGLASKGRMTEPGEILQRMQYILSRNGCLAGQKIVVTAGGTQEPLDPVRMLTNRSSGKQGYAIAQAALDLGADVTLVSAPTALPAPCGATVVAVRTAAEMHSAVMESCGAADALIMAAAVADFRPRTIAAGKIKKDAAPDSIALEKTSDILLAISDRRAASGYPRILVGFAAETDNLSAGAFSKLKNKKLDLIVGNDVSSPDGGFEMDTNRVVFFEPDGSSHEFPLLSKQEAADRLLEKVSDLLLPKKDFALR